MISSPQFFFQESMNPRKKEEKIVYGIKNGFKRISTKDEQMSIENHQSEADRGI